MTPHEVAVQELLDVNKQRHEKPVLPVSPVKGVKFCFSTVPPNNQVDLLPPPEMIQPPPSQPSFDGISPMYITPF